ncbi:MAG: hypothetical protein V3S32_12055 [Acidimicrobiia bacterium]
MKAFLHLLPDSHREWGQALLAEKEEPDGRSERLRWILGGGRLIVWSWLDWITKGRVMRIVLATLSVINIVSGLFLMALFLSTEGNPLLVLFLAVGLITQGGYTLWYMGRRSGSSEPWSCRVLLTGETIALLVGVGGITIAVINNINPANGDYEYGPIAVGGLIAAQAFAALLVYANIGVGHTPTLSD